ncbi:hypothetical protein ACFXTH_006638 [Malus domestica]
MARFVFLRFESKAGNWRRWNSSLGRCHRVARSGGSTTVAMAQQEQPLLYMGTNPANDNYTFLGENSLRPSSKAVNQRDVDLLHFWHKV